jgi:hypothetical protein
LGSELVEQHHAQRRRRQRDRVGERPDLARSGAEDRALDLAQRILGVDPAGTLLDAQVARPRPRLEVVGWY